MRLNGDGRTCTIEPGDKGADYVALAGRVTIPTLKALGIVFVIRYIARATTIGKIITPAEISALHTAGIALVLNYEGNHLDYETGADGGAYNGTWSREFARNVGYPAGLPLVVSIDTDITPGTLTRARQYTEAFFDTAEPYRPAIYADTDIARAVAHRHPIVWRPNATGWGAGRRSDIVHVQQHRVEPCAGCRFGDLEHAIDPNTCLAEFTAWLPHTVTPQPPKEDDDMTIARIWGHPAYHNRFLIGPSTVHLSPALATSYLAEGVPVVVDAHAQTLATVLHQCGLTRNDLEPV